MAKSDATEEIQPAQPKPAPPAEAAPEGLFPRSPSEAVEMIEQKRVELAAAERQVAVDQAQANNIRVQIDALNSLLAAQGRSQV